MAIDWQALCCKEGIIGLKEFLTKPRGFGSAVFYWNEPTLYRIRLRGDGWLRLFVVLGAWALGTGVLWAMFANNIHRPGLGLGIGLGAIVGGVAAVLSFFRRDHVSGRVRVEKTGIFRYRTYAGVSASGWAEWQEWPFDEIDSCRFVSDESLDKPFSVMVLALGDDREIVGIPAAVDLAKLKQYLAGRNVPIKDVKGLPVEFTKKLPVAVGPIVLAAGLVSMISGFLFFQNARGENVAQQRPELPQQVEQVAPVIQAPVEPVNVAPVPVAPVSVPADVPQAIGRKLPEIGAAGGFAFESIDGQKRPVIGFHSSFGQWAGKQWIRQMEPFYEDEPALPNSDRVMAKPGYAVGGLLLDTPEFVNAYAVIFMRVTGDGKLDPADSYTSDWIGPKSDKAPQPLNGQGKAVIGVHGRAGAILNAVGLVLSD